MQSRIDEHKKQRQNNFVTIEEPINMFEVISKYDHTILVECLSMWINNMLYHKNGFEDMQNELKKIMSLNKSIIFVLNDVGSGIIPDNPLAREFVDISGKLSQLVASQCDEVYHTIAGISTRIK
jgi:adenosylcobinamide kinase/adenosylcobinamide-phosphate guanylyltransferase